MSDRYWLRGTQVEPAGDLRSWGIWLEKSERRIVTTKFPCAIVSTVFLGIDHSWGDDEPPLLFETMVFPIADGVTQWGEDYGDRCSTYDEALQMHGKAQVWLATTSLLKPPGSMWDLVCGVVRGFWPVFSSGRWVMDLMSVDDFINGGEFTAFVMSGETKIYPLLEAESDRAIVNIPADAEFQFVEAAP